MTPEPEPPIAAANWPLVLIVSLAAVALIAATPFVVHAALAEVVAPEVALWASIGAGFALLVALAAAWVMARARRTTTRRGS